MKLKKNLSVGCISLTLLLMFASCEKKEITSNFEDQDKMSILDYVKQDKDTFALFLKIIETGKVDKILSAYNPNSPGYTLFLPTNDAIRQFIAENGIYNTLDEMLADTGYCTSFSKYHIVDIGIKSDDFPFGALPQLTLSGDILTVGFINEPDTSYYKINNTSPVIKTNIETSNGYIHLINKALTPIVYNSYEWLQNRNGFSIFLAAADATGLGDLLKTDTKQEGSIQPFTLLIEHDSVFTNAGIHDFDELAAWLSPNDNDFQNVTNPLHQFVAYHILSDLRFLDDFVDVATNYNTYSSVPLYINGKGLDIAINDGKRNYDTIVTMGDTTIIDYVGVFYDASNVLTRSGSIHFVNQIMEIESPTQATQTFEFYEEPLLNEFRLEPGDYLIEDSTALYWIHYKGVDLSFIEGNDDNGAWSRDYLKMEGDFDISYTIPKLVQGSYNVILGADFFNSSNAVVEVYIDGKKIGGLINTTTGGSASWPFQGRQLGKIDILRFEQHTVRIKALIPGRFCWDYIRFELISDRRK
jgi:uncharacterized surface protein with fasciclin (FAS1) repeats